MVVNRGIRRCAAATGSNVSNSGLSALLIALGCLAGNAYAFEFDDATDTDETATQADDTGSLQNGGNSGSNTQNYNQGWLGFGRSFLKPGNLTGDNTQAASPDPAGHPGGGSRLENSSGTTAWFNTGGFNDRGKYQLVPGWTFTPGFEFRETFTDNVALRAHNKFLPRGAPPNAYEDFVTELTPAIKLMGDERRLKFQLRYLAQGLIYANNSELSDVYHRLFSAAQAELLPQFLFFDGSTSISQQNTFSSGRGITSNFGPGTFLTGVGDNINYVGDRTDVLTYNLSPYIRSRLRNFAAVELRYTYSNYAPISESLDTESQFGGNVAKGYRALLESGPMFNRFKWRLGFDRRESDFSNGRLFNIPQNSSDSVFEKYFATLEYLIVPQFAAIGTVGYEDNSFANARFGNQVPRGVIWDIGGRWAPSQRTNFQATYGQRFFGDRYFFQFSHRASHMLFDLNYTEEATLGALVALDAINRSSGGTQGGQVTSSANGSATLSDPLGAGVPTQNSDVFIRRLLSAAVTYTGLRNDLSLQFYREDREYRVNSNSDQDLLGITGIWTHSLTRDTSMDAAVTWTDVSTGGSGQSTTFNAPGQVYNYTLNFNHRISHNLAALLGFRRIDRMANDPDQDYSENRVFGSIRINY